jgi:general secretion pathway protein L
VSILYIRSPSTAAASDVQAWLNLPWSFAVTVVDEVVAEGSVPLGDLKEKLLAARRTFILLAASDVTLLRISVPPLSAARLKQALPHLVEDQLMSDPAECVMVAGEAADGLRMIAVMQRTWLEALAATLRDIGANNVVALPAQLCLPADADAAQAAVTGDTPADLALRLSEHAALGFPLLSAQPETIAADVMQTLQALLPDGDIALRIPPSTVALYHMALNDHPALHARTMLLEDRWQEWVAGAKTVTLDLFSGMQADMQRNIDWRKWRWPLTLAACLLIINVIGLNMQWWHLKNEAQRLRIAMTDTFRIAYPKEKVIVDPLLQMQQKVAAEKRLSGRIAADDFIALAAAFGEAWNSVAPDKNSAASFAAIDYRERSLFIKPKADSGEYFSKLKSALAMRNLSLSQADAGAWQVRMMK